MNRGNGITLLAVTAALAICSIPSSTTMSVQPLRNVAASDPGVLLTGKVVTMNDAGEVWPGARLWVRAGRIEAITKMGDPLPAGAKDAQVINTDGVIYPGMIDLHNHPEFSIYPLMPIRKAYKDRYEWRFYEAAYNKRITYPQLVLAANDYYDLGMEMGRYGEYKAMAGGTTALQGGSVDRPYSTSECLVRNIENSRVGPRLAVSRVDIGRDAIEWADLLRVKEKGLLALHLAEGTSSRMATEYEAIKKSGLVGSELITIHNVGLTRDQFKDMAAHGAKMVWSPLSNFLLYGKTADVAAARKAGLAISLAPDWAPSGSKSILGELKIADLVNKHQLNGLFSDRELAEMVTRNPAQAMRWTDRAGQIAPGFVSDLVVMDDQHNDPYRNLIEATEENVRLLAVRGEMLYGDQYIMRKVRRAVDIEGTAKFDNNRTKVMAVDCPGTKLPKMSFAETKDRLQRALDMDPSFLLEQVQRRPDSVKRIVAELSNCPGGSSAGRLTAADMKRLLSCRLGLPYERTTLSPLVTNDDEEWMARLLANPNIPTYLKALPHYYERKQEEGEHQGNQGNEQHTRR
ncbi:amidohydrolase family protein [Streptomyces albipurpureus]|uniref:Amidohydrolase family protein n=1 Tax=Streptomyces albipurpureus TaxID=2897419 RepID=A0ABT0UQY0_9ACTN|nr:amidohydrolase family protein [Streptomyces sp. CWNU-1]MCM2389798.1 amidohydrolase family protein [Streptomyces sp. CWNU-1]